MSNRLPRKNDSIFFRLLQMATFCVFLGRAWQHLYWDAPFRALLWDETLMSGIIESFSSMNWEQYITSMEVNDAIQLSIKLTGIFYLVGAAIALFIKRLASFFRSMLVLGAIGLVILAMLYCKDRFFSIGQFFEYTLQFGSPLFLFFFTKNVAAEKLKKTPSTYPFDLVLLMKIAIALTFTCHGLYAIGYYPIPVHFMEMTMNILGLGEENAKTFLLVAGILDFIISIGIFLPAFWARPFLIYAILWGLITSMARIWANFNWEWLDYVLLQWLHEAVIRFPHFLIPLAVLVGQQITKECSHVSSSAA